MCGGGGSSDFSAQQKKAQDQANYDIGQINAAYSSPARQQQYTDYYNAVLGTQQAALAQQQAAAERATKFATARSGLSGGSQGAFNSQQLANDIANASAESVTRALNAKGALESTDQQQKQALIGLAQAGALSTGADAAATSAMQTSLDNAQGNNITTDFSNFFGNLAPIYQASIQADAMRRLGNYYTQQAALQNFQSPIFGAGGAGW